MNDIFSKRLLIMVAVLMFYPLKSMASAFQLWEQDGGNVGLYHAGYAVSAQDASTAFYNPAGMTYIKAKQLALGGSLVLPSFKYKGSVRVSNVLPDPIGEYGVTYNGIVAKGGDPIAIPSLNYVAPLDDHFAFGLSVVAPFGLETDYSDRTAVRYAATLSSIVVIDVAPSLAYKLSDRASIGAGMDVQRVYAHLDAVGTLVTTPGSDSLSTNTASGTGYGYHLGGMYELTPATRLGLSYHSAVRHHLKGSSTLSGPLGELLTDGQGDYVSNHAKTDITLPAYTAMSVLHRYNQRLTLLGSLIYTQWSVFDVLSLKNVAGLVTGPDLSDPAIPSKTIEVVMPEHYRNTWNVTVGGEYGLTDSISLRAGMGFDQSPSRKAYRNVQLPDNDRYVLALGTHIQATKKMGIDLGWSHYIIHKVHVAPPAQVTGAQIVSTTGYARGGADVFGAQLVWNFDT